MLNHLKIIVLIVSILSLSGCDSNQNNPIINLKGEKEITLEAGDLYHEYGYEIDFGKITDYRFIVSGTVDTTSIGTYKIDYDAIDMKGKHLDRVSRYIHVVDTTPPIIKLIGDPILKYELNEFYSELGAICTDNLDSICDIVIESSDVDTNQLGIYMVTYNAIDWQQY